MNAVVKTADGCWLVDVETEDVTAYNGDWEEPMPIAVSLPRVVASAASGATVVAVVDRRPPLAISHDAGRTWHEAGGGLPRGTAIALDADNPDRLLYAARNRLYVSEDGGRFWRALMVELPEIIGVSF